MLTKGEELHDSASWADSRPFLPLTSRFIQNRVFRRVFIYPPPIVAPPKKARTTSTKFERVYLLNGLIRCAACERNVRAQGYETYRYYREVSHLRGFECKDAKVIVSAGVIEDQIGAIIQNFQFPPDWQKEIKIALKSGLKQEHTEADRQRVLDKLKRLGELYLDGAVERQTYRSTREALNRELGNMTLPEPTQVIETGLTLESFLEIWPLASDSQKRDICRLMFEWIEVDMRAETLTRVMPKYEFTRFFEKNPRLVYDPRGGYVVKGAISAETQTPLDSGVESK